MNIYKTNCTELKKYMIENNIKTIVELSKKTGIGRNTLSKVLEGKEQPSSDTMEKLVFVLKIPPRTAGDIFFSQTLIDT